MRRFQIHKISTKLILTYSLIVFLIFVCMCMVSLSSLNRQYKRELIRSDKEALRQISNSIVLMTDLMAEKTINVYSDSNVQEFFADMSHLDSEEFRKRKAIDYDMVKKLKGVRRVLRENAVLYTQVNGGTTLITEEGAIYTSWLLENSLDYSSSMTEEKEKWDNYFDNGLSNYKWEIMNGRDAMSFQQDADKDMLMCIYSYRASVSRERKGYICVCIDAKELKKCYESWQDANVKNEIFLIEQSPDNGRMVSLDEEDRLEIPLAKMNELRESVNKNHLESTLEDEEYIYNCIRIPERGWVLVNKIPLNYIGSNGKTAFSFIMIFLVGCLSACALVIAFTFRFSRRINYLKQLMQNAAFEQYNSRYEMQYYDELDEIGESFNLMEDEIKKYTLRLIEEEKEKKLNEINYLHAQINTHFLYNIFNSIKMLSVLGRNEDINKVITSLVRLLKGTMDVSSEMLTIEEELRNVEHYFQIENIIHLEELELEIKCDEKLKKKLVPKLLIQPIVENSFLHGFSSEYGSRKKQIEIVVEERGIDELSITVRDNGRGIDKKQLMNIKSIRPGSTRGIGLRNIEDRIQVLFGENYGIQVESVLGKGTRVILNIPMIS
ncbi:histidine kinase [Lachnospiraceae bacterium 54-11]